MSRSAVGLTGTWLLSCLPIALPALWAPAEFSIGDASRLPLAALPWLAWIGSPLTSLGKEPGDRGGIAASAIGTASLSAPPLIAAMAVDLERGRPLSGLAVVAAASLTMIFLLALAARLSARRLALDAGSARRFALAWGVFVPGLPLLRCTLEVGGAPFWGPAPAWLAKLADASPIAWAWERAAPIAAPDRGSFPWAALAVCLALLAISGFPTEAGTEGVVQEPAR